MSKQDGYSPRTAADLERKYNFGKSFADIYGLASDARSAAIEAKNAYEGLTTNEIFNLLTDFGESQGVYRDDTGNVYVNASFIKSGKLSGANLEVDAATITGTLDATKVNAKDLEVSAAKIVGKLTAGQIDATDLKVSAANITGVLTATQIDTKDLFLSTLYSTSQDASQTVSIANGSISFGFGSIYDGSTIGSVGLHIQSSSLFLHSDNRFYFRFADGSYWELMGGGMYYYDAFGNFIRQFALT